MPPEAINDLRPEERDLSPDSMPPGFEPQKDNVGEDYAETGHLGGLPDAEPGRGELFVVATPIGNLSDITLRAIETLRSVHRIAAEDTRHTRKLLSRHDIHTPLVSYHDHNARERGPDLVARMVEGERLALVTDAGTPGISDPGYPLIEAAIAAEVPVTVIPGPSAVITALVASGLPTHPFVFFGFPPNRAAARERFFRAHAALPMTAVFYESPKRLAKTLAEMLRVFGDRRLAVARELTKIHEEIFRGSVSGALEHFASGTLGEVVIVLEGAREGTPEPGEEEPGGVDRRETSKESVSVGPESTGPRAVASDGPPTWREALRRTMIEDGLSVREATDTIAPRFTVPRKTVYREALRIKDEG